MKLTGKIFAAAVMATLCATAASAGPIIIDGTDANDHGSFSGGANQDGWFYMQRALESLQGSLGVTAHTVLNLGADTSQAGSAINSAFTNSTLAGSGWNMLGANGTGAGAGSIDAALSSLSTATTGILYISTVNNSSGDLSTAELAVINAHAADIAAFVNNGGALFAMSESDTVGGWDWLTSIIPTINPVDLGGGGTSSALSLTAAGATEFPGLNNGDLSAGPWHNYFTGTFGSLQVLAQDTTGRAVILGGGAGAVLAQTPEPVSLVLLCTGLVAVARRRFRRNA